MLYLDHMLYAVPVLEEGIETFADLTGVRPDYGGKHTNLGTHNALVSLGERIYFEIIAPDPEQDYSPDDVAFNIGNIQSPKIITWAARAANIEALETEMAMSEIKEGFRIKEDGAVLKWKTARLSGINDSTGLIPFIIEWQGDYHPADTSPKGCDLLEFSACHPSRHEFEKITSKLAFPFAIGEGPSFQLTAKIGTPKGVIEIS